MRRLAARHAIALMQERLVSQGPCRPHQNSLSISKAAGPCASSVHKSDDKWKICGDKRTRLAEGSQESTNTEEGGNFLMLPETL